MFSKFIKNPFSALVLGAVFFIAYNVSADDAIDCESNTCVSTWAQLKTAVETVGGTIYVLNDIEAEQGKYISKYVDGTVIKGQGFSLTMPENDGST